MSAAQREAFRHFTALVPGCRLQGSTAYGLPSPSSDVDVDVCVEVEEGWLKTLADGIRGGGGDLHVSDYFQMESNQLHLTRPRLILKHTRTGSLVDVVGMHRFEEDKDTVMGRVCEEPTFRAFLTQARAWWKAYNLQPADGYPSTFNIHFGVIFMFSVCLACFRRQRKQRLELGR